MIRDEFVKGLFLALAVSLPATSAAQTSKAKPGRIVGTVVDASYGVPISGAQLFVVGTTTGTTSAIDGRFTLLRVAPGTVDVRVRMIGYGPKTISGIVVPEGGAVELDVSMAAEAFQLAAITVTAAAERGTVRSALDAQRTAPTIISAQTAEQIARSPDGDAGQAVKRVSGVTVQDDKYVFVRGLGERYTTTSLNNARIPSPEPERKVVPLDLFPSSLLEAITTSKTFTPEQPGDFSGAQVNLKTREFPLGRKVTLSASAGFNGAATGKSVVRAPRVGREWLGFAGDARQLPQLAAQSGSLAGKTQDDLNQIIGSFRNVWSADRGTGAPSASLGLSVGGEDPVFRQPIGYLASFTYSYSEDAREDERRAVAVAGSGGTTRPQNAYFGSTGKLSVLWGGLFNLSTRIGSSTKISSNNTFTRTADNEATSLAGSNEEFGTDFNLTRLTFTERTVRSSQLVGEHRLANRHTIEWSATASGVSRSEPDRSDVVYEAAVDSTTGTVQPFWWFGAPRSASRTFGDLSESAYDLGGNYSLALGTLGRQAVVKVGGTYRTVNRESDDRAYEIVNIGLDESQRSGPPESVFSQSNALAGQFTLFQNVNVRGYTATERLWAGYLQLELPITQRVRLVGGARVERAKLEVEDLDSALAGRGARLDHTDILPSLALNIKLTDRQNVRLSATQTLSRPEYRELSEAWRFDLLGSLPVFGNRNLHRALIQNYDARWEWYLSGGEAIAIGLFAKRFDNPIEKVIVATTGASALSFVNAESASNFGVEVELRKGLGILTPALERFTLIANSTLMRSTITPGNDSISSLTNADRPMVGQSGYVLNAGLGYSSGRGGVNATLLYNVTGRRIVEAGQLPLPDAYEEARHLLDFSMDFPVPGSASFKLNAKNLLDSPYVVTQGEVDRVRYRTGRSFSVGLSWSL